MECIGLAAGHLKASGSESPRLDAELLLGEALGLDRVQLYVQHDRPLTSSELDRYRKLVARRARREPIAYILGRKEFRSLEFNVDSRVLIPRPETEHLVQAAVNELRRRFPGEGRLLVADIGTGSGAVAAGIAAEEARAEIVAVDIDAGALEVARANLERHGLADRVRLRLSDLLEGIAGERFHAVVSNPPYVSEEAWRALAPDVREFEPRRALVGGEDGLAVIRRLVAQVAEALLPGGFFACEIGWDQGEKVRALGEQAGFATIDILPDLAGRDRVVVMAKEPGTP